MKRIIRLITLLLSLTFLFGCELALLGVGAGLGAGGYRYVEGSLGMSYPVAYDSAWEATNTALANLNITVSESIKDDDSGRIEAVKKDGTKVFIKLKDEGQGFTGIKVRVGFLGSREESEMIHEEIKKAAGL